jgi:hypothetical protein
MQINFSTAPAFNPKTPDLFISKAILASLQYKHVDGLNQEHRIILIRSAGSQPYGL